MCANLQTCFDFSVPYIGICAVVSLLAADTSAANAQLGPPSDQLALSATSRLLLMTCCYMQDYNNVDNSMLELVFAPAADWIARSDQDIIDGEH